MHIFIAQHKVNRCARHISIRVQMVSVDLDNNVALLDTFLLVDDLLVIFLISVIFPEED